MWAAAVSLTVKIRTKQCQQDSEVWWCEHKQKNSNLIQVSERRKKKKERKNQEVFIYWRIWEMDLKDTENNDRQMKKIKLLVTKNNTFLLK